jgi:hypothetical protein
MKVYPAHSTAACREADQKLRQHQSKRQALARGQDHDQLQATAIAENIILEIDRMDVVRLDKFLEGRPKLQVEKIFEYITGQLT